MVRLEQAPRAIISLEMNIYAAAVLIGGVFVCSGAGGGPSRGVGHQQVAPGAATPAADD